MTLRLPGYALTDLPPSAQKSILVSHVVEDAESYRTALSSFSAGKMRGRITFDNTPKIAPEPSSRLSKVIWATDMYEKEHRYGFGDTVEISALGLIRTRVEKSKEEQKRRVKEKAEVFTPTWVVNKMNNFVDEQRLYPDAFNTVSEDDKIWEGTKSPLDFSKTDMSWEEYVLSPALEMTAGEAPYLFSRYDPTSGDQIPIRNAYGNFQRVGMLDRKLRVVFENTTSLDEWLRWTIFACMSTYGYEWQGDNLLLARLNMVNTVVDFYKDAIRSNAWNAPKSTQHELIGAIAEISSWQLWQMDGLKMVQPLSCSEECVSCSKNLNNGHDGVLPVIKMGGKATTLEAVMIQNQDSSKPKKK